MKNKKNKKYDKYDVDALLREALRIGDGAPSLKHPPVATGVLLNLKRPLNTGIAAAITLMFVAAGILGVLYMQPAASQFESAGYLPEIIKMAEMPDLSEGMQKLVDINPDFFAWIRVSHTKIDYPVVQAGDNQYYLNHSFERKQHSWGTIFADFRNRKDIPENRHLIIYGHNMLDGSMFQPLPDFGVYKEYFETGIIELITEDAVYYYEIFSAREEDPRSGYIEMSFTDEEWVEFLYEQQERSSFTKNLSFTADSRIVTLSTCVNDATRDWRFVVQGVLVEVKN